MTRTQFLLDENRVRVGGNWQQFVFDRDSFDRILSEILPLRRAFSFASSGFSVPSTIASVGCLA